MSDKSKQLNQQGQIHRIPAGIMVGDKATELFGDRTTRKVFGISNGQTMPFSGICSKKRAQIQEQLLNDEPAMNDLKHLPLEVATEHFAFCVYGAADSIPDFDADGKLGKPDNFICSQNCRCLNWSSKQITIEGNALTLREVEVMNKLAGDKPAKQIAAELNISESTLDTHKRNLFEKAGVHSTTGLVVKAAQFKVIQ